MKHRVIAMLGACLLAGVGASCTQSSAEEAATGDAIEKEYAAVVEAVAQAEWVLLIHGGAGVISRDNMTAEKEAAYRAGLEKALEKGGEILSAGGSALDAVEAAVVVLEDDPSFNAGRGAVLTAEHTHELDASIMSGVNRNAGAVAGLKTVRNPIKAARAVMDRSQHVMFASEGADKFAREQGLDQVSNDYFTTQPRLDALERVLKTQADKADKRGTVGAVALDMKGDLAAATSTGGMTAKTPGRVGDSPLIGAGAYADNAACAVSATGHGEFFIRVGVAQRICMMMEGGGLDAGAAGADALRQVADLGGDGGVIILSPTGDGAFVFDTPGMFRGFAAADGRIETAIYSDR